MSEENQNAEAQSAPAPVQKQSVLTERSLRPAGRDANGRVSRLQLSIRRDCISLGAPLDGEWLSVLFTISEWDTLLINLNQAVLSKEAMSGEVDAYVGAGDQRRLDGTVRYGRDEDGIIYLTFINNGREQRFDFRPSDNYVWKLNGQPIPPSDASRRNAQAWITRVGNYAAEELRSEFVGFQGRQDGQGGQQGGQRQGGGGFNRGGGNNYNRGGGNNYNRGNGNNYQGGNRNYRGGNGQGGGGYNRNGNGYNNGGGYRGGNGQGGNNNYQGGNRSYQGNGNYQNQGNQNQGGGNQNAEPSVDFDSYISQGL